MNKNLFLILLIPLLVVAEEYEAITVGMKASYTKKVLEQIVIDTPIDINIDKAKHGKLLMSSVNLTIDPPYSDGVETYFNKKNNSITIEMKNQKFMFESSITIKKALFKINGRAKTTGIIDKITLSFGLTTQEGQYTNGPAIYIKDIDVKLNQKGWEINLSTKWLDFMMKPLYKLIKKLVIKSVSKLIEDKIKESTFQQIHEELTRVSGRFMIDDGVLVDHDALDAIHFKDGAVNIPYEVTYYLPQDSEAAEKETEVCESDCENEQDSEAKLEQESEKTYKKINKFFLIEQCIENNQSAKFCFGRANPEQQVEHFDGDFSRIKKYFLPALTLIYNNAAMVFEGEE
ncbi:unnamed protein product [Moneuplotes crassus]|uniref:Lipid-binding serum glycoprotein N-terminal domain-containing protein n=1 Tax=Euplotes crassus TaxID=5936 RepID=A0AAD1XBT6_EUPCR|nr:unnamed protein product [Moneuplotes crassus]